MGRRHEVSGCQSEVGNCIDFGFNTILPARNGVDVLFALHMRLLRGVSPPFAEMRDLVPP